MAQGPLDVSVSKGPGLTCSHLFAHPFDGRADVHEKDKNSHVDQKVTHIAEYTGDYFHVSYPLEKKED